MDVNGFIHFSMKLHGTVSGRLSSSPNVQNLPKRTFEIISPTGKVIEPSNIRGIFTAPPGYKVFSVDLSQAELRIMADYAKDYVMFDYIKNKIDTHWRGCQKIFYDNDTSLVYNPKDPVMKRFRKLTKLCNFGGLYGGSNKKKVQSVNEKLELGEQKITIEIADKHTDWFNGEFFRIHEYVHEMGAHIKRYGWIDNKFGRRRRLPDSQSSKKWLVAEAQRQGINTQIQGTASDIAQCGFMRIQKYLEHHNFKSRLIFTVHDECVGYLHENEIEELTPIIPELMVIKDDEWLPLDLIEVPLESEIEIFNNRWGD
jgi:DNA polymerase-1